MQLIILTNRGTSLGFKELNDELKLSSFRIKSSKKNNPNYKQVCTVEIRGKFHKKKRVVDDEVVNYLIEQLHNELKNASVDVSHHKCLHIYAHDITLGLKFGGMVSEDTERAVVRPNQMFRILRPYLILHPECTSIKFHVCFSGCDYGGSVKSFSELFKEELEMAMDQGMIEQQRMVVEGCNGWSILGNKRNEEGKLLTSWHHFVLPRTNELRELMFFHTKVDYQNLIEQHALDNVQGKPKFFALPP